MKRCCAALIASLLAWVLLVAAALAASGKDLDKSMEYDGLAKIRIRDVDLAYVRPGASLAGYHSIKLDPVDVAFRKDWNPNRTGSRIKLSAEERENIRTGVAKVVFDEFVRELESKSGYKVVTEAASDVLRVKVNIVDLYVNAPDTHQAGRSRTYVVSAGEMTLVAELFDSESGEILARVVDRREARNSGRMTLSSSVGNAGEAASIASAGRAFCARVSTAHIKPAANSACAIQFLLCRRFAAARVPCSAMPGTGATSVFERAGRAQFRDRRLRLFRRRPVDRTFGADRRRSPEIHTGVLAYARSLDIWGKSGKVDIIVPYSQLTGTALVAGQPRDREINGLGDPRIRFSVNLYGAPALSLQEFAGYRHDLVVGASVQVAVPAGQYDPDRLVNLGANRWSIKPDVGFSQAFGSFTLDLTAGVTFYGDNDDYFGGQRFEQAPVYSVQTNLSWNFDGGMWVALGATYYNGGRTTTNGVRNNDALANARAGVTLALPVNRYHSIKFNVSDGVTTRIGTSFRTLGVRLAVSLGCRAVTVIPDQTRTTKCARGEIA
jgi:hypothetical protein